MMPSRRFVTGPMALPLARVAERFGTRPSAMIGPLRPWDALRVDLALGARLGVAEQDARRRSKNPARGTIDPSLRYEDPSEEVARLNAEALAARVH